VDTLQFSNLASFSDTLEIWLEDRKEDQFQLLTEDPQYIFTSAPQDDPARFVIWFYNPFTFTGVIPAGSFRIWSFEDRVYVDLTGSARQAGVLTLFDLSGRSVYSCGVKAGKLSVFSPGLTQGVYVARLCMEGSVASEKLFIR